MRASCRVLRWLRGGRRARPVIEQLAGHLLERIGVELEILAEPLVGRRLLLRTCLGGAAGAGTGRAEAPEVELAGDVLAAALEQLHGAPAARRLGDRIATLGDLLAGIRGRVVRTGLELLDVNDFILLRSGGD